MLGSNRDFGKATDREYSDRNSTSAVESGNRVGVRPLEPANFKTFRQHERTPVCIRAIFHLRGQFQTTTILDVSVGGACLEGAYSMMPGDKIVIELTNGRKLAAEARWWICGRCGVSFAEKLAESDPLLIPNFRLSR